MALIILNASSCRGISCYNELLQSDEEVVIYVETFEKNSEVRKLPIDGLWEINHDNTINLAVIGFK